MADRSATARRIAPAPEYATVDDVRECTDVIRREIRLLGCESPSPPPPAALESERVVVASVIWAPEWCVDRVLAAVRPLRRENYYDEIAGLIFAAARRLAMAGTERTDAAIIAAIDGGPLIAAELERCRYADVPAVELGRHVRAIIRAARYRRVLDLLRRATEDVHLMRDEDEIAARLGEALGLVEAIEE
jgi:hypothetical protein